MYVLDNYGFEPSRKLTIAFKTQEEAYDYLKKFKEKTKNNIENGYKNIKVSKMIEPDYVCIFYSFTFVCDKENKKLELKNNKYGCGLCETLEDNNTGYIITFNDVSENEYYITVNIPFKFASYEKAYNMAENKLKEELEL